MFKTPLGFFLFCGWLPNLNFYHIIKLAYLLFYSLHLLDTAANETIYFIKKKLKAIFNWK